MAVSQKNFEKIPGSPIGYWVSESIQNLIFKQKIINEDYQCREGIHTTDNKKYIRLWHEVSIPSIAFNCSCYDDVDKAGTWVPYNKGGGYRKWYGLNENNTSVNFYRKIKS